MQLIGWPFEYVNYLSNMVWLERFDKTYKVETYSFNSEVLGSLEVITATAKHDSSFRSKFKYPDYRQVFVNADYGRVYIPNVNASSVSQRPIGCIMMVLSATETGTQIVITLRPDLPLLPIAGLFTPVLVGILLIILNVPTFQPFVQSMLPMFVLYTSAVACILPVSVWYSNKQLKNYAEMMLWDVGVEESLIEVKK